MPDWRRELTERLAGLPLEPARAAEIVEELSQHLADRHAELIAGGASPEDAERQVRAELHAQDLVGGLARLRQASWRPPAILGAPGRRWLGDLAQDVRYGLRTLRRAPAFTAAAVLTLGLGIGANSAIFSLVNATLLQALPVRDPAHLFFVRSDNGIVFSYPEFADVRDHQTAFDGLVAWGGITASLNSDGRTDLVSGLIVTGDFFEVLGVGPAWGRLLSSGDDRSPGAHPVAVISHGFWRRRFGGRADIAGHEVLLDGHRFTIVGVTPPSFTGAPLGALGGDLFVPMMMQAVLRPPRAGYSGEMDPDLLRRRDSRWLFFLGRLKPGWTPAQVEASLAPLGASLAQAARPGSPLRRLVVAPARTGEPAQRAQIVPVAVLLLSVVGLVLLLACANVANLSLSRAAGREREIAIRLALGASGGRLVRQTLTESVLVALGGAALGLALAGSAVAALRAASPPPGAPPLTLHVALDVRVFAFTLAVSVLAGLLFGLAPALGAARTALVPALKDGHAGAHAPLRRLELRDVLVAGQVALSLMLLVAAGLFLRSLHRTQTVRTGFDTERLLAAPLQINLLRYTRDQGVQFYRRVIEDVEALPGVESAALARVAALSGSGRVSSVHVEGGGGPEEQFRSEGGGVSAEGVDSVALNVVDPGYFETLGIRLVAGRRFGDEDGAAAPAVAVVNEAFEHAHFAGGTGRDVRPHRISLSGPSGPWLQVIGIVRDSKYRSLTEPPTPIVYLPLAQNHESGMVLYVRTSGPPAGLVPAVRRAVQSLEPNLPLPDVLPVKGMLGGSLYMARMGALLLGVFGGLALVLSAVGVYGVMALAVSRRTREIGVRMALGAHRRNVLGLVLADGLRLVLAGTLVGLAAAFATARSLQGFLYGMSSVDAVTFAAVPLILVLVALAACLVPARRAARVDPLVALRSE